MAYGAADAQPGAPGSVDVAPMPSVSGPTMVRPVRKNEPP